MTEDEIENIIDYYVNLLIIQYNNKERARSTIRLFVGELWKNDLYDSVLNGYDIDTATGVQLDVLSKYIGLNRNGSEIAVADDNFFSLIDNDQIDISSAYGLIENADIGSIDSHILGVETSDIIFTTLLTDQTYRFLLKLKIILNNSNLSEQEIDNALFNNFGTNIIPSSVDGAMVMTYLIDESIKNNAITAFEKGLLPKPMAVGLPYIIFKPTGKNLFGYSFDLKENNNISGYSFDLTDEGGKLLFLSEDSISN